MTLILCGHRALSDSRSPPLSSPPPAIIGQRVSRHHCLCFQWLTTSARSYLLWFCLLNSKLEQKSSNTITSVSWFIVDLVVFQDKAPTLNSRQMREVAVKLNRSSPRLTWAFLRVKRCETCCTRWTQVCASSYTNCCVSTLVFICCINAEQYFTKAVKESCHCLLRFTKCIADKMGPESQ